MTVYADRVAVVTGAASGIGRALCDALLARGAIVVGSDRDKAGLDAYIAEKENDRLSGDCVDVTKADEVERWLRSVKERHERIDLVFNNAGIAVVGEIRDLELDDWYRVLDVNLRGVIHGVHAAYPIMIEQGSGHIVNIASGFGLIAGPGAAAYVASKHAVVGLTMSLREEALPYGVRASVVCPGFVQSNIYSSAAYRETDQDRALEQIPMKMATAESCAKDALEGVRKNVPVITTPRYVRLGWWAHRLNPSLVHWLARRQGTNLRRGEKS